VLILNPFVMIIVNVPNKSGSLCYTKSFWKYVMKHCDLHLPAVAIKER
jgi:hypothetical protein